MSKEQELNDRFRAANPEQRSELFRGVKDQQMRRWMELRIKALPLGQHRYVAREVREEIGL